MTTPAYTLEECVGMCEAGGVTAAPLQRAILHHLRAAQAQAEAARADLLAVAEALGRYHDTDTERFPARREVLVGRIAEIRAAAWEEGYEAASADGASGATWQRRNDGDWPVPPKNPYRKGPKGSEP